MNAAEPIRRAAVGRPPLSRKGDVEERLLDAATRLFLALGFEGTSCDQVAQDARAGKASIYARYANKTALLTAVVEYKLGRLLEAAPPAAGTDVPLRERVLDAAGTVVKRLLQPDAVALLRLIVAEAPRLQADALDAARILDRMGTRHIALAIAAYPGAAHAADAPDGDSAAKPAAALVDMVLAPALLRALLGAELDALREAAHASLAPAVDRLIASGALDRWS
jgi:AcrR family transcriptional regulator